jgi:hypothetical protein
MGKRRRTVKKGMVWRAVPSRHPRGAAADRIDGPLPDAANRRG